jgi:photosystem II stability/assembly factor-like uncharacterized protein
MKNLALLLSLMLLASGTCFAQTTAITYQGKLSSGGAAANGDYQFEFKLFDSDLAGNQTGATQTVVATVQNGIFTTRLDFGAGSFPADADRWLEIGVRPNGSTDAYTVLSPRQQLNSVPYAIRSLRASNADNAANATNADNAASLGGVAAGNYVQTNDARLSDARPPAPGSGNYIQNSASQQAGNFNISGNAVIGGTLTAARLSGDGSGLTNIRASFLWETVAVGALQAQPNTGYLVTSREQATITLPDRPNVGDVIRVSSAGLGGWKIAQNAGQAIRIGGLGQVGESWTAHESVRAWTAIASAADGSSLVAVVDDDLVYTSTDAGLSWTPRNALFRRWRAVASSADGAKLVAVVYGGQIYTSTDSGATWTPRESARSWQSVASSADGTKLVAVVSGGFIYVSTNSGATWTQRASNRDWTSVASSSDGTKLVAVATGHQGERIYTSTDAGTTWTAGQEYNSWRSVASSADGSKLVAVARDVGLGVGCRSCFPIIYTSTNSGVSWTPRPGTDHMDWISVASSADGNKLIAAARGGQIYLSKDAGATWAASEANRQWAGVASSADGSRLVAVVTGGQLYTSSGSLSSTTTLGPAGDLIGGRFAAIELQYVGGGLWMPLSHEGTIVGH